MVDIICDTSFLIHLANNRIKNLATLETEIGDIRFVVPDTVIAELTKISTLKDKKTTARVTIDYVKSFKTIKLGGDFADEAFVSYIKKRGGIIATMDKELKYTIKKLGGSVMSITNNKIVLESSKV